MRVRHITTIALALGLVASPAAAAPERSRDARSATSCIEVVARGAYIYDVYRVKVLPNLTRRIRNARLLNCSGTPSRIPVFKAAGVQPRVALLLRPSLHLSTGTVNIALGRGFFPALVSHPLHRHLYPRGYLAPERAACTHPVSVSGSVIRVDVDGVVVDAGEQTYLVYFDSETTTGVRARAGLPFIAAGDRLHVHGKGCEDGRMLLVGDEVQAS